MGDALNFLIFRKLFGYTPIRHTPITCSISGIGSGLGKFCYADKVWLRILEKISGFIFPNTYIWGTGFMEYRAIDRSFFRKNMKFCAVRGQLSKNRVEKIIGRTLDIPTGDGGILASELISSPIRKKYRVGIIPHIKEQDEKDFKRLAEKFKNAVIIDLLEEPLSVVKKIAECEYIISSSLHGLIVADSFHIPNIHVKVTNNMLGDGFKFDDYYSGYGLEHKQYREAEISSIEFIAKHYEIKSDEVEVKKQKIKAAFPFPIKQTN